MSNGYSRPVPFGPKRYTVRRLSGVVEHTTVLPTAYEICKQSGVVIEHRVTERRE